MEMNKSNGVHTHNKMIIATENDYRNDVEYTNVYINVR